MKQKREFLDQKVQEKMTVLMEKGHEQKVAQKRANEYRKELKEKLEREERAYWRAVQDRKFGKLTDISQDEGKDYLSCIRKR